MTITKPLSPETSLEAEIQTFLSAYGPSALLEAMRLYTDQQQTYICRTKSYISRIRICDIYYLTIRKHHITIFTGSGIYQKYGTLSQELNDLSSYGFAKCNQSCIVSLDKIRMIQDNDIFLMDGTRLYVSRTYAPRVLTALNRKKRPLTR